MYSQSIRPFSQEGEDVQVSQNQYPEMDSYDRSSSQQMANFQHQEENSRHSTRAESLLIENRQIRLYMESTLKELEKRRLKLINKSKLVDEEYKRALEVHTTNRQESLNMQMELENLTDMYRREISQRKSTLEKTNRTLYMTSAFENHFAEAQKVGEDLKKIKDFFGPKFEECYKTQLSTDMDKLKSSFKTKMENILEKCNAVKEDILNQRESRMQEIQALDKNNTEKSNNIALLDLKIRESSCKIDELDNTSNNLMKENAIFTEETNKLQQQCNEFRVGSNNQIQDLKLQINTEENQISNLELKCLEKQNNYNGLCTRLKEKEHLSSQLLVAVDETAIRNEKLAQEIEEIKNQNTILISEITSVAERIEEYKDAENTNMIYKNKASEIQESITSMERTTKEKEESIVKLQDELENVTRRLADVVEAVHEAKEERNRSITVRDELVSKHEEEKLQYEQAREHKLLRNQNLDKNNEELAAKIDEMERDLQEMKVINQNLRDQEKDTESLIKQYKDNEESNKNQIIVLEEEENNLNLVINKFNSEIHEEQAELEDLLSKLTPKLDELPEVLARKSHLEQKIREQEEDRKKEEDANERNYNNKILEMDREMENYSSIMNSLIGAEETALEKLKKDIETTEETKHLQENKLKSLVQKLKNLKTDELSKRSMVAKLEKRMRTITKEVKVTSKDISEAIRGNNQNPAKRTEKSNKLSNEPAAKKVAFSEPPVCHPNNTTTPQNPAKRTEKSNKLSNEPAAKKVAVSEPFRVCEPNNTTTLQGSTKKWDVATPENDYDEFEFSEI